MMVAKSTLQMRFAKGVSSRGRWVDRGKVAECEIVRLVQVLIKLL